MTKLLTKYRYALCCAISAVASLLSFVNPVIAGIVINRAIRTISVINITPVLMGMAIVNVTRILLRSAVASLLKGHQRSPLIWIQNRIGKWLWWLEPALHVWGLPGILMKKLGNWLASKRLILRSLRISGRKAPKNQRLTLSIASSIFYLITDTLVTALSGLLFYFTHSFAVSLLAVLLPAAAAVPWFTKKSKRVHHYKHGSGELSNQSTV